MKNLHAKNDWLYFIYLGRLYSDRRKEIYWINERRNELGQSVSFF